MTDNIHIIACGEELLSRVAFAMQEKGLSVSCSGCAPDLQTMLENGGVFVGSLQQAVSAGRKVNFVVSPALGVNPEIEYAEAGYSGVGFVYISHREQGACCRVQSPLSQSYTFYYMACTASTEA